MHLHINGNERDIIAVWKSQEMSVRSISKRMGRSPASVSREIRRPNRFPPPPLSSLAVPFRSPEFVEETIPKSGRALYVQAIIQKTAPSSHVPVQVRYMAPNRALLWFGVAVNIEYVLCLRFEKFEDRVFVYWVFGKPKTKS